MKTHFVSPKILLMSGGAEFGSETSSFISMTSLISKEQKYSKNLVKTIRALKPNLVII
jgi:hypothetical protein